MPNVCEGLVIECKELMIALFVVSDIPNGPMDFDKSILNLTFTSSQREINFNVAIVDDLINEADQQFICIVRLTNPSVIASGNVIIKNPSTVIRIADDDRKCRACFSHQCDPTACVWSAYIPGVSDSNVLEWLLLYHN